MTKAIMIQGAGSNVGKSVIVAGLARAFTKRGLKVAPFKPQNMSNNAAVTVDGGEIGRAQALQARAARIAPTVDMNPVLLKPETDTGAQVIVQGQRYGTMRAQDYGKQKATLLPKVLESFTRLAGTCDLIVVEGAGSPAEINLRSGDIANMGFADAADIPVVLVGDIDRGGVIAQMVGTHTVLPETDRARIKGFMINKFRGDVDLFKQGAAAIETHTNWANLGVVPWFQDAWRLPAEDIMDLAGRAGGKIRIAVPRLNRIANFDDLDPLTQESDVTIEIVEPGRALPGDATMVLLLGTKSTISDLAAFRANGWDIDLAAHIRRGGHVLGICGGYQMLGQTISDPDGIEGHAGSVQGLGHLDVHTTMKPEKKLGLTQAIAMPENIQLDGYEIHIGLTDGPDCAHNWLTVAGRPNGAMSATGTVKGCYLHGLFGSDAFRRHYLTTIGAQSDLKNYDQTIENTLDLLSDHLEASLDLDAFLALAKTL